MDEALCLLFVRVMAVLIIWTPRQLGKKNNSSLYIFFSMTKNNKCPVTMFFELELHCQKSDDNFWTCLCQDGGAAEGGRFNSCLFYTFRKDKRQVKTNEKINSLGCCKITYEEADDYRLKFPLTTHSFKFSSQGQRDENDRATWVQVVQCDGQLTLELKTSGPSLL